MPLSVPQIEDSFALTDKRLLSNILNLNVHYESNEKLIFAGINKLLSVSKTRLRGLELLNLVIGNCSECVASENAINWVNHCIIRYDDDSLREIKLATIGKIVANVHNCQDFTKKFVSDCISKVLDGCLKTSHVKLFECEAALDALIVCMKYYASWFGPHYKRIENYLVAFLDVKCDKTVEKAALAFHYLQQTGGAGADAINHRQNFTKTFHKLCATIQKLFDAFFERETEMYGSEEHDEFYEFEKRTVDSRSSQEIIATRIKNCLTFLSTAIRIKFPVAKEIKVKFLLNLILRGTAIHSCLSNENEKNSLENYEFSLILNNVQIQLLQLLRVFIVWFQGNSLPFSYLISKILIDCLNKCQSCDCFKSNSLYQETVYKTLASWLKISKNSFHVHFQERLVTAILKDVVPVKNQVTLSIKSDINNAKSTKAKRRAIQERIISSGRSNTSYEYISSLDRYNQENNCIFALNTLKTLLNTTELKIPQNLLQDTYTSIFNAIMDVQTSKPQHPYFNTKCQEKICEILVAFYEQENLKIFPPLQTTITILNRGVNCENQFVRVVCERGLSLLERLSQPICPPLYLDNDVDKSRMAGGVVNGDSHAHLNGNLSEKVHIIDVHILNPRIQNEIEDSQEENGIEENSITEENEENTIEDEFSSKIEEKCSKAGKIVSIESSKNEETCINNESSKIQESDKSEETCVDESSKNEETCIHNVSSKIQEPEKYEEICVDESSKNEEKCINNESSKIEENPNNNLNGDHENEDINVVTITEEDVCAGIEECSDTDRNKHDTTDEDIHVGCEVNANDDRLYRSTDADYGPPAKKSKMEVHDDDDLGDVFEEKCGENDEFDPAEDSFVDEVKGF